MFNWIDDFIKGYQKPESYELLVTDVDGNKHSLVGLCASLAKQVVILEDRITKLEEENISTTNELYRLENSLDARIDILMDKTLWKTVSE